MPKKIREVHNSIRTRLGYSLDESISDLLKDWKQRTTTVCKPCWELKYCPYGPLVEQLPLLPVVRSEAEDHDLYLRNCLATGMIGQESPLDEFSRERFERILTDDDFAEQVAISEVGDELRFEAIADADDPLRALLGGPLPPLEEYRVPFDVSFGSEFGDDAPEEVRERIRQKVVSVRQAAEVALKTGIDDDRKPLDAARRKMFEEQVNSFNPDDYPDNIPDIFQEASCNIFGHICPVFFAAESITETSEDRRRGRYIPFSVKMRVVRRDNHTCQECGVHLRDDEVEFDHKIPVSKGGSSEEHNIRLTCFDCNRDKSARVDI